MNSIEHEIFTKLKNIAAYGRKGVWGAQQIRKAPSEQEEAGFSNQKAVKVCYALLYTKLADFVTPRPSL
jgi:hypothetical protein